MCLCPTSPTKRVDVGRATAKSRADSAGGPRARGIRRIAERLARGDVQSLSSLTRHADCRVEAFLGRDATQKREIPARLAAERQLVEVIPW